MRRRIPIKPDSDSIGSTGRIESPGKLITITVNVCKKREEFHSIDHSYTITFVLIEHQDESYDFFFHRLFSIFISLFL